jgi:hypothetical protein
MWAMVVRKRGIDGFTSGPLWGFPYKEIMDDIKGIRDQLPISREFLDCSLVGAHFTETNDGGGHTTVCEVSIVGDGGFFVEFKDGNKKFGMIEFDNNAPLYMSYVTNGNLANYFNTFPEVKATLKIINFFKDGTTENKDIDLSKYVDIARNAKNDFDNSQFCSLNQFIFEDVKFVTIFSDGVKSFSRVVDGISTPINEVEIVKQIVAYKNFNGDFVKRRMMKMQKDYVKENITHYDDVSVATIYAG